MRERIPTTWCGDLTTLTFKSDFPKVGGVLILHAEFLPCHCPISHGNIPNDKKGFLENQDKILQQRAEILGEPSFKKIDLRILVYRPDKVFRENEKQFGDIIIRNEGAFDKKR